MIRHDRWLCRKDNRFGPGVRKKLGFQTKGECRKYLRQIRRKNKIRKHLYPYLCPLCGEWHMTSNKKRS